MSDDKHRTNWARIVIVKIAGWGGVLAAILSFVSVATVAGLPIFAGIVVASSFVLRLFEEAVASKLGVKKRSSGFDLLQFSKIFGKKMNFGVSSGVVAELLKTESRATYWIVAFSMLSAIVMYVFHVGDWRFSGGIAALTLLRHGLTVYRVITNRFGTTPDELIELMGCLRQLDRTGKPPPDHTGLVEPVHKSDAEYEMSNALTVRGV